MSIKQEDKVVLFALKLHLEKNCYNTRIDFNSDKNQLNITANIKEKPRDILFSCVYVDAHSE